MAWKVISQVQVAHIPLEKFSAITLLVNKHIWSICMSSDPDEFRIILSKGGLFTWQILLESRRIQWSCNNSLNPSANLSDAPYLDTPNS